MKCKDIQRDFHRFLDGELKPDRVLELQEHISHCADCRQNWQELHDMRNQLHALPRIMAPRNFTAQVLQATQTPQRPLFNFSFFTSPVTTGFGSAVVIAAVVLLVIVIAPSQHSNTQTNHIALSEHGSPLATPIPSVTPLRPQFPQAQYADDMMIPYSTYKTWRQRSQLPHYQGLYQDEREQKKYLDDNASNAESATYVRKKRSNL